MSDVLAIDHEPSDTSARARPQRWWVLFCLIVPFGVFMTMDKEVLVVLAPAIHDEFAISYLSLSKILSAVAWGYAICQIPSGILVDLCGARLVLAASCVIWSTIVFVTPFCREPSSLTIARFLLGCVQAPVIAASVLALRHWFDVRERATTSAAVIGGTYVGSALGGPLTSFIASQARWQTCFFVYGVLGLLFTMVFLSLYPNFKIIRPVGDGRGKQGLRAANLAILRKSQFWAIGMMYFSLVAVESFFQSLMPIFLNLRWHVSVANSGWLFAFPWITLCVSVAVNGALSDYIAKRWRSIRLARTPLAVCGFLLGTASLSVALVSQNFILSIVLLCVSLFGVGMAQVSIWSSIQDIGDRTLAFLTGWVQFAGNSASGFVPIVMMGQVHPHSGWGTAAALVVPFGVFGVIMTFFVRPHRKLHQSDGTRARIVN